MKSNFKAISAFFAALVLLVLPACATILPKQGQTVELQQDSVVTQGDGKPLSLRKGQSFKLGTSPAIIEAPGRVGMVIVQQTSEKSNYIKVALKAQESWDNGEFQARSNQILSDLLIAISEVQVMMASAHYPAALARLGDLEVKHPGIAPLKFLKANCLFLSGDQNQAKAVLERAIREYPNYEAGKELYRALGGNPASFSKGSGEGR